MVSTANRFSVYACLEFIFLLLYGYLHEKHYTKRWTYIANACNPSSQRIWDLEDLCVAIRNGSTSSFHSEI